MNHREKLDEVIIPASDYAVFKYRGIFKDVFKTAIYDLYKCISITGHTINDIGIKFFEVYKADYYSTKEFEIYLPIITTN